MSATFAKKRSVISTNLTSRFYENVLFSVARFDLSDIARTFADVQKRFVCERVE